MDATLLKMLFIWPLSVSSVEKTLARFPCRLRAEIGLKTSSRAEKASSEACIVKELIRRLDVLMRPISCDDRQLTLGDLDIRIRLLGTPFNLLSRDSELSHSGNQRGPVHPEPGSGAIRSPDNPAGVTKCGLDVRSIRILQRSHTVGLAFRPC